MTIDRRRFLASAAVLAGGSLSFGCTRALDLWGDVDRREPNVRVLDEEERARLIRAVDLILPETETPGAVQAGVPDFIEMMLVDYYYDDERSVIVEGLDALETRARARAGVGFVDAPVDVQVAILTELEQEGLAIAQAAGAGNPQTSFTGGPADPAPAFFQSLRELVAVGYTTSKVAALHVVEFTPMHLEFEACVPVDATRRSEVM